MACGSVGQRAVASSYRNEDELMDQVLHPSSSGAMETAHYLVATAHSDIRSRDDGRACFQPPSNRFGPVTLTMLTLLRGDTLRREPEPAPAVATADGSPPATRDNNWRCETAAEAPIFNEDVAPSNSLGGTRVATSPSTLLAQTPEAQAAEPQPQARATKIQRADSRVFGDLRGFSRTVHSAPAGGEIPPLLPLPYLPRISGGGSAQGGDHVRQPAAVVAMVGRQQAASPTYGSTNPTGGAPQPPPPQSGWQPQELPSAAEGVAPTMEAAAVTLRGASTAAMPVSTARDNLFGGGGGASAYAGTSLPPLQSWPGPRAAEYDIGSWCTAAAAAEPVQLDRNAGGTPYAPSTRAADVAIADPNAAASAALPGGFHPSPLTNYSVDARSSAAAAAGVATRTAHCAPAAPLRGAMPLQLSPPPPLRSQPLPPPVQVQVASRCRRGADKSTAARGRVTRGAVGVFHPRLYLGGGDCIECGSEMMSRGRFERLAGTATAKWHVSIKVLPSGMTLGRWLKQHGLPILQGRPRRRRFASEDGEEEEEQDEVEVDADAAIEPTAAAAAATNARSDDTSPLLQLHPTPPPPLPPLCAPSPPPIFPVQSSPGGPSPSSVGAAATTATAAPSLPATVSAAAIFAPAAPSASGGIMSYSSGHETGSCAAAAEPLDASLMDLLQSSGILDDIYSMNERPTGQSAGAAPPCGYPVASASSLPTPPLPSKQAPAAPSLQPSARASAAGSVAPLSELQEGNMYGSRCSVSSAGQVPDQDPYATVPWAGCGGSEGPFSTAAAAAMVSSIGGGCSGGTLLGGSGNGSAGGSSNGGGGGKSDSGRGVGLDPCASAHSFSASTQDAASRTAIGVPPPCADATYGNNGIGANSAGCGVPSAAAATTCDASAGGGPYGGDGGNEASGWQLDEQLGWCRAYSSAATSVGAAVTVAVPGLSSSGGGKYAAAAAANQHAPDLTALQQQPAPQPPDWPPPPPPPLQQQQQQQQQHLVPLAPGRCVLKGRERAASNSSSTAHPPPQPQPPLQLPPPHPVPQQLEQPQPSSLLPYQSQRPEQHHHHHLPQSPAQSPNHHPGRLNHYHPQLHQHHHHPPYSPYSPYQSYQYPPRLHHYQQQQLRHHPYELSPSRALQQQRYDVRHGVRLGVQQAVHPEATPEAWQQHHQQQHSYAAAAARSVGGGADGSPRRPFKVYDRPSLRCIGRAIGWARSQPEPQGPRAPAPLFSPPVPASTFPPQLLASWEGDGGGSEGGGGGDAGGGWRGHEQ